MTEAIDNTQPDAQQPAAYDDLTQIKGIGEVTQQWLRETFAVRTYRDLARVSPAAIEKHLKAGGKVPARSKIQEWLAQARQLAARDDAAPAPADVPKQGEWKTFSTFVVMFEERQIRGKTLFQTKAHHMEADRTEAWPGIVQKDLIQWITEQLGPKALHALEPVPAESAAPKEPDQARFSATLSQYVAKAYDLAGEDASPLLQGSRHGPSPEAKAEIALPPAAYSGKLRQFITKARHLAGDE